MDPTTALISRTRRVPAVVGSGDGSVVARQLDAVLATIGFTCSAQLLEHLAHAEPGAAMDRAVSVIAAAREMVGDHVRHNAYFRDFPANVPETLDFWVTCLRGALLARAGTTVGRRHLAAIAPTVNLLDLPTYGTYQHTFEELLAAHDELVASAGDRVTVLHLGGPLDDELRRLYRDLARSTVPLTPGDLALLADLAPVVGNTDVGELPVRENRAAIDAVRVRVGLPLAHAGTLTDVLRVAAALSDGDLTLVERVRFASLPRGQRRALLAALDRIVSADRRVLPDVHSRREAWKRLGERLHAREYADRYPGAAAVFAVARGELRAPSVVSRAESALRMGDPVSAARVLAERPGVLARSADRLLRACETYRPQEEAVLDAIEVVAGDVSGRVLCGLREHLENRVEGSGARRLFVNRRGRAHLADDRRARPTEEAMIRLAGVVDAELLRRAPAAGHLVIDPAIRDLALPLSGKAAADGFAVLPRGTTTPLPAGDTLRFFSYWRQTEQRTDFDLSALMLDADLQHVGHVSWTNYRNDGVVYSGDITSARDGATEFIDVPLAGVSPVVRFLVPQVHVYAGEGFEEVAESLFGWMIRDRAQSGLPFEARTVRTASELRARGRTALPAVFARADDGSWSVTWLHLGLGGTPNFNQVETAKVTTTALVSGVLEHRYLTVGYLLDQRAAKAARVSTWAPGATYDEPVTYVGLTRPEDLPDGSEVVTLGELGTLIPG